MVSYRSWY